MITFRTLDINGLWNKLDTYEIEPNKLVPRFQLKRITRRFQTDHVELIIGPRQSGKTTLLMMLIHELDKLGIPPQKIFYINLDTIDQLEQFKNPMLLVDLIDHFRERGEWVYLFLDEAQRLEAPGKFLKGIYDLKKKIKVFASSSSTLELRSKIKEFLTGRKRETHLYPLSFKELIRGENKISLAEVAVKLDHASAVDWQQKENLFGTYLTRAMDDMLIYGGYPAVLTTSDHERRAEELEEIYFSYVKKDIIDFLKVERTDVFNHLVKVLASQVGNLINKSEICSLLGSNTVTVTKYMNILQETYIAAYLPPFVSSKRNEIRSSHKSFFMDNGLRNFALRQFNPLINRTDKGALIENLVFTELVKDNSLQNEKLFFWRTKGGAEVDFVLQGKSGFIPIEIKAGTARPGLLSKSFHAFLDHFSPEVAVFLNRNLFHVEKIKNTNVFYVPNHWFLLFGLEIIE